VLYQLSYAPNVVSSGGGKRIRTADLLIANETLYQLSYTPLHLMTNTLCSKATQ
jgi:hypothetical protein